MTEYRDRESNPPAGYRYETHVVPGHYTQTTLIGRRTRYPRLRRWIPEKTVNVLIPIPGYHHEHDTEKTEIQIPQRIARPASVTAIHAIGILYDQHRIASAKEVQSSVSIPTEQAHGTDIWRSIIGFKDSATTRLRRLLGR
jgi:hypothetical protein